MEPNKQKIFLVMQRDNAISILHRLNSWADKYNFKLSVIDVYRVYINL